MKHKLTKSAPPAGVLIPTPPCVVTTWNARRDELFTRTFAVLRKRGGKFKFMPELETASAVTALGFDEYPYFRLLQLRTRDTRVPFRTSVHWWVPMVYWTDHGWCLFCYTESPQEYGYFFIAGNDTYDLNTLRIRRVVLDSSPEDLTEILTRQAVNEFDLLAMRGCSYPLSIEARLWVDLQEHDRKFTLAESTVIPPLYSPPPQPKQKRKGSRHA